MHLNITESPTLQLYRYTESDYKTLHVPQQQMRAGSQSDKAPGNISHQNQCVILTKYMHEALIPADSSDIACRIKHIIM
jgi:hypothetical protein